PPFPNMATAAWGAEVIEGLAPEPPRAVSPEDALALLHSLAPGSERRLVALGAALPRSGEGQDDRSLGAALAAAGLVLDPRVEGYKARLVDAHGLMAYAGTFSESVAPAQAARAFVAVATGRVYDGEKLIGVMSAGARPDADTALLLAL